MQAAELEYMIQVKTYEMRSPTGAASTLKLCWSERLLLNDLFRTSMWQRLRMGSSSACWRLVEHQ